MVKATNLLELREQTVVLYLVRLMHSSPLCCRFSVSNDLKYDAERDLRDIGAKNIQVHSLNKVSHRDNRSECLLDG